MSVLEDQEHIRSPRIKELEGLRGCLAWWVVLFHVYQDAGLAVNRLPKYEIWVCYGPVAVDLFIILSGYVIFLLLETQKEPYAVYLTRRFFRVAPLYAAVCACGVAEALWKGLYGDSLIYHILLHLTMLHGLVPNEVLPGSATSLNFQSWSISVEWQFYLVAPAILAFIRGSANRALLVLVVCLVASTILQKRFEFPFAATAVMRAGLFAVGIASFYLTRLVTRNADFARPLVPFLLPIGIALAWVAGANPLGAFPLWVVVFSTVIADLVGAETWLTRPFRRFLGLPVVVWLGTLSYSTYLSHELVFNLLKAVLGDWMAPMSPRSRLWILMSLGFPLILALSAALYHFIEKPGMALGKSLAKKMRKSPVIESTKADPSLLVETKA
jgi:peptidoglycan/LPS O-acetylase OafA/YrhL